MKSHLLILSSLFLISCGDKEEDSEITTDNNSFTPADGTWNVGDMEEVSNTCGMEDDMSEDTGDNEDDTFQLTANGSGNYTLQMDDETILNCSLSDYDLTCDPFEIIEADEESDMTFIQSINVSGVFASETVLGGNLKIDMSCEGEGCALLEMLGITVPCSMTFSFQATQ
jgi:hypothetical protein